MLPVFLLVASLASVEGLSKDHCLGYDVLCTTADYENIDDTKSGGVVDSEEGYHGFQWDMHQLAKSPKIWQFRRYNESVWVGTAISQGRVKKWHTGLLRQYLNEQNSEGMMIKYSGHALASISWRRVLTIHYMLPEELWDNPPTATNPRVFITRLPRMDVFARKIRRFLLTDVGDFNRTLTEQNVPVNNSNFFMYSCLRKLVVLRQFEEGQEIWFVSTGGFDCPAP